MNSKKPVSDFPALFDRTVQDFYTLAGKDKLAAGRSHSADLPILDAGCSRQQFIITAMAGHHELTPLSERIPTLVNNRPAKGSTRLSHGDVLAVGNSEFVFFDRRDDSLLAIAQKLDNSVDNPTQIPMNLLNQNLDRTVLGKASELESLITLEREVRLSGQMLLGRDTARVQIPLVHSSVSRLHAQITAIGESIHVVDLNSANGTFVNGRQITSPTRLVAGDRIDIGPFSLAFDGRYLLPKTRSNNIQLSCRNLTRTVTDPSTRQTVTILDKVNLVVRPGEFACILGPSGSGKSTLLSALSGRHPADEGEVLVNETDLYSNFEALKEGIAVVPQRDALHEALTVEQALRYSAELRLPPDTDRIEVAKSVDAIAKTMGLEARKNTRIKNLSGGQLKRASLANEMISQPSLLFVDEATSGLDENTDREMMCLFRSLADTGKTVVCITHNLANVEKTCNLLIVLAAGGKLAFVGQCSEALEYFGVEKLGDIYLALGKKSGDEWKEKFLKHPLYVSCVGTRLKRAGGVTVPRQAVLPTDWRKEISRIGHDFSVMLRRYVTIQKVEWQSTLVAGIQCLLVAVLLGLVYGDLGKGDKQSFGKNERSMTEVRERFEADTKLAMKSESLLFLVAVSCIWFGCNNSAKEMVKEIVIYLRERAVKLSIGGYFLSKLALLSAMSVSQAVILLFLVKTFTGLQGGFLSQLLMVCTLAFLGTCLGLLISAIAKTEDVAITAIPLVLIPQIILGDVVVRLSGVMGTVAQCFVSSYWGFHGLVATLPKNFLESLERTNSSVLESLSILFIQASLLVAGSVSALLILEKRDVNYMDKIEAWIRWAGTRQQK
jgi:ABC-type multidrug transport system ATPase subunit